MNMPLLNAISGRAQQAIAMVPRPLGVASGAASRGFDMLRTSPAGLGVGNRVRDMFANRPRVLGLGVSSQAASGGQTGASHIW